MSKAPAYDQSSRDKVRDSNALSFSKTKSLYLREVSAEGASSNAEQSGVYKCALKSCAYHGIGFITSSERDKHHDAHSEIALGGLGIVNPRSRHTYAEDADPQDKKRPYPESSIASASRRSKITSSFKLRQDKIEKPTSISHSPSPSKQTGPIPYDLLPPPLGSLSRFHNISFSCSFIEDNGTPCPKRLLLFESPQTIR